jgi:ATP synthase protein I
MKPDKKVLKAVVMITQIGISMLVPIFLCVFVGIRLDEWLGTNFITVIGVLLGIVVAFRNVYIMTKQFYAKDKAREDAELKYIDELKQRHHEDGSRK